MFPIVGIGFCHYFWMFDGELWKKQRPWSKCKRHAVIVVGGYRDGLCRRTVVVSRISKFSFPDCFDVSAQLLQFCYESCDAISLFDA